jgi:hypothetical protein
MRSAQHYGGGHFLKANNCKSDDFAKLGGYVDKFNIFKICT